MPTRIQFDNPKSESSDDRLGRSPMALNATRLVMQHKDVESLTVGIIGSWGSGKSTFLNFIRNYATDGVLASELAVLPPLVLEFNPWWFNDRQDLFTNFLKEILSQLRNKWERVEETNGTNDVQKQLLEKLKRGSKQKIGIMNKAIESLGIAALLEDIPFIKAIPKILQGVEGLLDERELPLTQLRAAVEALLLQAELPVWIFIEDFDRLEGDSVRHMIGLLRSFANLPYTRYFIAFDPNELARQLEPNSADRGVGEQYIDKLVQFPFFLSEPSSEALAEIFSTGIKTLVNPDDEASRELGRSLYNDAQLNEFYIEFQKFLPTIRQINRFLNALQISHLTLNNDVNFEDLMRLELLKVSEPAVWSQLAGLRPELLGPTLPSHEARAFYAAGRLDDDGIPKTLTILIGTARQKEQVEQLLKSLFPRLAAECLSDRWVHTQFNLDEVRAHYRIADHRVFKSYFGFQSHEVSTELVRQLMRASNIDETALRLQLEEQINRGPYQETLALIDSVGGLLRYKPDKTNLSIWIKTILEFADLMVQNLEPGVRDEIRTALVREAYHVYAVLNQLLPISETTFTARTSPVTLVQLLENIEVFARRYTPPFDWLPLVTNALAENELFTAERFFDDAYLDPSPDEWEMIIRGAEALGRSEEAVNRLPDTIVEAIVTGNLHHFLTRLGIAGLRQLIERTRNLPLMTEENRLRLEDQLTSRIERGQQRELAEAARRAEQIQ